MHILWTVLMGLVAFLWVLASVDLARGVPSMPSLADAYPLPDAQCPRVSILFAARDEAEKLPGALVTFLSLDYPNYEVIAVDDRSEDGTGAILEAAASRDARLKRVRVDKLPAGWLGKPHALEQAYEHASGEWLIFTDADVHFAPDLLRRAIALADAREWDHVTLLGALKMFTFGEKIAMTFFAMAFAIGTRPWAASDPGSRGYSGVGAFQMIRRSTYEAIGTHRRLAMEVVDDMKLGKLVKDGGFRSGAAKAGERGERSLACRSGQHDSRDDEEFFRDVGIQAVADRRAHFRAAADVRVSGGGAGIHPRMGARIRCDRGRAAVDYRGGGGAAIRCPGDLRADVSAWGADFRVDAGAVDDRHAVAGRDRVARDVLSAG